MTGYVLMVEGFLAKVKKVIFDLKSGVLRQELSTDQLFYFETTVLSVEFLLRQIELCVKYDGVLADGMKTQEIIKEKKAEITSIMEDFIKFNENLIEDFNLQREEKK